MTGRRTSWLLAAVVAAAFVAAIAVVVWLAASDDDGVLVARPGGPVVEAEEGDFVEVVGVVREPDFSPLTGSADDIAAETRNVIIAESVGPAENEEKRVEPAPTDVHEREARGERVRVVGEVTEVSEDRLTFVLDVD